MKNNQHFLLGYASVNRNKDPFPKSLVIEDPQILPALMTIYSQPTVVYTKLVDPLRLLPSPLPQAQMKFRALYP